MIEYKKIICINNVSLKLIEKKFFLPIYIYNYNKIMTNIFNSKIINFFFFYSMKSNDNLFLLKIINYTLNKFDIVSLNELNKLILISINKPKIIFSGSGKNLSELLLSINLNIFCINFESFQEIFKLIFLFNLYKKNIKLMIRINPNIDALTHKKISTGKITNKFGICLYNIKQIFILLKIVKLKIIGYDFHIGSQIITLKPIKKLLYFFKNILNIKNYRYLDIGGGLGIDYYNHVKKFNIFNYYSYIKKYINKNKINLKIITELGRYFFCNTCYILSKINYLKYNNLYNLAILNLGMNDLLRPSLYDSYHKIESYNIGINFKNFFGPICESSDYYYNKKNIKIKNNSLIIFHSTGSYCKVLSNNYNSKIKIYEILIYNNKIKIIYNKENFSNLIKNYE
ncbi:diaminopimelate decarboxylase family protein [Candidatus Carsonella ruddii]|uniref:Diaminopimelate decarboxylase n=1 Tax=Candidatus Carsonella ruddii CE isolate Thao2000 TaxID=1202536 RepID=J7H050_CARRU|nr:diaminopimelate decarboxylase [Candidatus Carsonella ruddii]AFP83660.1 diaminopimelate decarboxylase [Candidatus Carsonella ruddii CE isolate Thao2000]